MFVLYLLAKDIADAMPVCHRVSKLVSVTVATWTARRAAQTRARVRSWARLDPRAFRFPAKIANFRDGKLKIARYSFSTGNP
jgi:hypothetical protein